MRDEKKSRRISRRPYINRLGRNWLTNDKAADNKVEFCASENGKIILKRELRSSACAHFFLCEQRFHSRIRRRVTTSGPRTLIGARKTWHCIDYGYLYVFSSDDKSWIFYLIHRYIHNTHTHMERRRRINSYSANRSFTQVHILRITKIIYLTSYGNASISTCPNLTRCE